MASVFFVPLRVAFSLDYLLFVLVDLWAPYIPYAFVVPLIVPRLPAFGIFLFPSNFGLSPFAPSFLNIFGISLLSTFTALPHA